MKEAVGGRGLIGCYVSLGIRDFMYLKKKKKKKPTHNFPVFNFYYFFAVYSGDLAKNPEKYESLFIEDHVTCLSI